MYIQNTYRITIFIKTLPFFYLDYYDWLIVGPKAEYAFLGSPLLTGGGRRRQAAAQARPHQPRDKGGSGGGRRGNFEGWAVLVLVDGEDQISFSPSLSLLSLTLL